MYVPKRHAVKSQTDVMVAFLGRTSHHGWEGARNRKLDGQARKLGAVGRAGMHVDHRLHNAIAWSGFLYF